MQAECTLLLCLGAEWWLRKLKEGGSASFGDLVPVLESRFLTVSSWVFICKRDSDSAPHFAIQAFFKLGHPDPHQGLGLASSRRN